MRASFAVPAPGRLAIALLLVAACLAVTRPLPAASERTPVAGRRGSATRSLQGAATSPGRGRALPLSLWPETPEQGRTLFVSLPADDRSSASGWLGAWPIHFVREGDRLIGLVGIHALAKPRTYSLTIVTLDGAGNPTIYVTPVAVADGRYFRESLRLNETKAQLLDPKHTIPERERVAAAVRPVTPTRLWSEPFQLPAAGHITSAFGTRRSYNGGPYNSFHGGVDFSRAGGADILAPANGVVVLAEALLVRGGATIIDHGWGVYSGFWHQAEILVKAEDVVQPGQVIGKIGSTGLSTGPHLHWELFVGGVQVDPMQWTGRVFPPIDFPASFRVLRPRPLE